ERCGGCPAAVDVNDAEVQRVANLAVAEVQKSSNSSYQHRLVRVVEATSQIVSGINYVMTIEVGHDEPKDGGNNVQVNQRCQVTVSHFIIKHSANKQNSNLLIYNYNRVQHSEKMNILHISGLLITLLLIQHSIAQDESEECPGCVVVADPGDPDIQKYAQFALEEMKKEDNCTGIEGLEIEGCSYVLQWIVNVTSQTVDGQLLQYDLRVQYVETTPEQISVKQYMCLVDVLVRNDSQEMTERSCHVLKFCGGCWENVNHNAPEVIQFAEDAVQEIQRQANCTCVYILESIVHARRDFHDGETVYYILHVQSIKEVGDEVIVENEECEARVHVNMWRDKEKITIYSCEAYQIE
ncbi:hypothetical protein L9F63_017885, partial [Diploptera punctata]